MTLVTRGAMRMSRRGAQAMKNARANAALFNTSARVAQNVLPNLRAESSRASVKQTASE